MILCFAKHREISRLFAKALYRVLGFFFNNTVTENELNVLVNVPDESSPEKEYLQPKNSGVM